MTNGTNKDFDDNYLIDRDSVYKAGGRSSHDYNLIESREEITDSPEQKKKGK